MASIYGTDDAAEAARLSVQRLYYKQRGLSVRPERLKLVHLVLATCRALLRQLDATEEAAVIKYLTKHPVKTRKK